MSPGSLLVLLFTLTSLHPSVSEVNSRNKFDNPSDCNCRTDVFCPAGGCRCIRDDDGSGCASVCTPKSGSTSFSCTDGNNCCGRRRRNLEEDSADWTVFDNEPHAAVDDALLRCGELDYEIHLFVTSHLFAVATPGKQAAQENCPFFVTDADYDGHHSVAKKRLIIWESKSQGEQLFADGALYEKSHPIGLFPLSELHRAYKETDPSASGPYDIVHSSCATYTLNLAQSLDVAVDTRLKTFVASRLFEESSEKLMDDIREGLAAFIEEGWNKAPSFGTGWISVWNGLSLMIRGPRGAVSTVVDQSDDYELVQTFVDKVTEVVVP